MTIALVYDKFEWKKWKRLQRNNLARTKHLKKKEITNTKNEWIKYGQSNKKRKKLFIDGA